MWIEASVPLTIRRHSGDVRLIPGQPVDFPEDEALKLLARAHGKVRESKGSCDHSTERETILAPGARITWQGLDGGVHEGVMDFLHACPGEVWAFCTLPDGTGTAVNVKYLPTQQHADDGEGPITRGGQG